MQEFLSLKFNGVGNAWPVKLGQVHNFYSKNNFNDLANASYSIISHKTSEPLNKENINWEILIDAGHGTVQNLITSYNRIPEAIILTHPHFDHILGVDWIVQSYYRVYNKKYPVYASKLCWQETLRILPHLNSIVEFIELIPGELIKIKEANNLELYSFPVFHGTSAPGAHLLAFNIFNNNTAHKVVFTGDVLCTFLREKDIKFLQNTTHLIIDSNNRFPYPGSNHWSITSKLPEKYNGDIYFRKNKKINNIAYYSSAHISSVLSKQSYSYFNDLFSDSIIDYCVLDFVNHINAKNVYLVHYSGAEDEKYYHQEILNKENLRNWINYESKLLNINSNFIVPKATDIIPV
ncbi:MAG: MBL fold metallo-hydrolase [Chlorobi bacterium]|nr:MBL fold metallo-hydrolase [Chlorobiota bacterium]